MIPIQISPADLLLFSLSPSLIYRVTFYDCPSSDYLFLSLVRVIFPIKSENFFLSPLRYDGKRRGTILKHFRHLVRRQNISRRNEFRWYTRRSIGFVEHRLHSSKKNNLVKSTPKRRDFDLDFLIIVSRWNAGLVTLCFRHASVLTTRYTRMLHTCGRE